MVSPLRDASGMDGLKGVLFSVEYKKVEFEFREHPKKM